MTTADNSRKNLPQNDYLYHENSYYMHIQHVHAITSADNSRKNLPQNNYLHDKNSYYMHIQRAHAKCKEIHESYNQST